MHAQAEASQANLRHAVTWPVKMFAENNEFGGLWKMLWKVQFWCLLVICSRWLVQQIERHASQNLILLGGKKEAVSWMNWEFRLTHNGGAWKQGSWEIVRTCKWLWQFWNWFWSGQGASADYLRSGAVGVAEFFCSMTLVKRFWTLWSLELG